MIRAYQKEDQEMLLQLIKSNTPEYFHDSEAADFRNYLDDEVEDYFVVEEAGKIIGAGGINYFYELGKARISWDMIHPTHHGKGIGSKLLRHRISILENDPEVNFIEVRTTQKVYEFYQKNDFKLMEVERDFWAPGFDLYLMNMPLEHD